MTSRAAPTVAEALEREFVMRHTPFSRSAVFDPHTLTQLQEAFDRAWSVVVGSVRAASHYAARLRLATIIMECAAEGEYNLLEIKIRAIAAMQMAGVA